MVSGARFDPTMAIAVVCFIAAFFCIGFFAGQLKRCIVGESAEEAAHRLQQRRRRRPFFTRPDPRPKCGLADEVIKALPLVRYKDMVSELEQSSEDRECPVCLAPFEADDNLRMLPGCSHVFHFDCIAAWFLSHTTCPLCRASLLPPLTPKHQQQSNDDARIEMPQVTATEREVEFVERDGGQGEVVLVFDAGSNTALLSHTEGATTSGEGSRVAANTTRVRADENVSMSVALLDDVNQKSNFKFSSRKPPLTSIRRSKSVGTDLKSLRDLHLVHCEGTQHNIENEGKYATLHVTAPSSCAQLPLIIKPQDHWVTVDIINAAADSPGAGASTSGENAKSLEPDRLNSSNSEKWSFSNFIGVVFPLRRTSSELVLPTQTMPVL